MGERLTNAERAFQAGTGQFVADGTEPCRGRFDLYWPDRHYSSARRKIAEAIEICAGCHRRQECGDAAEARMETDSVWGGIDFYERYNPEARRRGLRHA